MKLHLALLALATFVFSGPVPEEEVFTEEDGANMKYFLVETSKGVFEIEDLVNSGIQARADESDLTYHFFSRHNPVKGVTFKSNEIDILKRTEFRPEIDTVFVVHGWKDDNESTYNVQMRETVLSQHDVNVFVIDWAPIALKNYLTARYSVGNIGRYIGSFVQSLVNVYGLDLSRVTFVGHSLGAHISGNAGAALGGRVGVIVGLDPAGPLFTVSDIDDRLDPTDARFVHVIHTNGGLLGFQTASGHADYYPNGGSSQAGCILDIGGGCSHARSYAYYTESILSGRNLFVATQCSSYNNYNRDECSSNTVSLMAGYNIDRSANGEYYLDTNTKSPYAKG